MLTRFRLTLVWMLLGLAAPATGQEPAELPLLAPPANAPTSGGRSETAPVQERPAPVPALPARPGLSEDQPAFEELPMPAGDREIRRSEFPLSPAPEAWQGDSERAGGDPPPRPQAAIGSEALPSSPWNANRDRATGVRPDGLREPFVLRFDRLGLVFYFDPPGQRRWGAPVDPGNWGNPPSFLEPPSALDDPDAQRPVFDRPATLTDRLRQEQPVRRRPLRRLLGRPRD